MEEMFQTVIAGYFIFCLQNRLWGIGTNPQNYTVTANYTISLSTTWLAFGIGIVAPTDNNAKVVSSVLSATTNNSTQFRTELAEAPSIRWFVVGK